MRILILRGDGSSGGRPRCDSPISATRCTFVDNYLRRRAHEDVGTDTLVPILGSLPDRAAAWKEVSGYEIGVTEGDLVEWDLIADLFRDFRPEAIVHYGEMPSAPYSMRDRDHAVFTQQNNVVNTLNVLWAMREFAFGPRVGEGPTRRTRRRRRSVDTRGEASHEKENNTAAAGAPGRSTGSTT